MSVAPATPDSLSIACTLDGSSVPDLRLSVNFGDVAATREPADFAAMDQPALRLGHS